MLFEPPVQLCGLPKRFQKLIAGPDAAERRADDQAVREPYSLPRQPRGQFAENTLVLVMQPELRRTPDATLGPDRLRARFGFCGFRLRLLENGDRRRRIRGNLALYRCYQAFVD